jgi:hypothetical protein
MNFKNSSKPVSLGLISAAASSLENLASCAAGTRFCAGS